MRDIRVPTAIVVLGLCAFAVSRGWDIVLFANAKAGLVSGGHAAPRLLPWAGVPGLAVAALAISDNNERNRDGNDGEDKSTYPYTHVP